MCNLLVSRVHVVFTCATVHCGPHSVYIGNYIETNGEKEVVNTDRSSIASSLLSPELANRNVSNCLEWDHHVITGYLIP